MDKNLKPAISVVMCCYNAEKYIAETIESVLNQTFTNFEFIIWNDGSNDNTEQIVKSYKDCRIRYFYHSNMGIGMTAHLACLQAMGKYIARLDADDICMLNRLEVQVKYLESHPQYVLISSSVYYMNERGNIIGRSFPYTWNSVLKKKLLNGNPISQPASMFMRDAYLKTGGYVGVYAGEDRILFARMSRYGKIKNLANPLIKYRLIYSSLSHRQHGSPYSNILEEYRKKMIKDDIVSLEDIVLHNKLYNLRKLEKCTSAEIYSKRYEEYCFSILQKIFGEKSAQYIVLITKNVYGIIVNKN